MSFFSDLAVAEVESVNHDTSYPSPEQQIVFLIEDIVSRYLQLGGSFSTVEAAFEGINTDVSAINRELLYSVGSYTSPSTLINCLKTALSILEAAENDVWNCSTVLNELKRMFAKEHSKTQLEKKTAA